MQLIIPDCCLGEFCSGIHAEGHRQREDGTYYSTDNPEGKAFHYHNTDGSVFYRYPDGSEYYRRKNGNIQFRPPPDPSEKAGEGEEVPKSTPAPAVEPDRGWRPWHDWPPQLNLAVGTYGASVTIRDESGSTVTFEPVGTDKGVEFTPARDSHHPPGHTQSDTKSPQPRQGATFVQEWVKKQALADILGREKTKDLGGAGNDMYDIRSECY